MAHPFPSTTDTESAARTSESLGEQAHHGIDRISGGAHQAVERVATAATSAANPMGAPNQQLGVAKDEWIETARATCGSIPWQGSASPCRWAICSRLNSR